MAYTVLSHVTTGDLATAALHNSLLDNLVVLKTSVANDGRLNGEIERYSQETNAISISSNVLTVALATGNHFSFTLNANITTMTITTIPASGKLGSFILEMTANGTGYTWEWLTSTVKWPSAVAPTMTTTNGKVDRYGFLTRDEGANWIGYIIGQKYAA